MADDEIQPKRGRPFRRVVNGFEDMPERRARDAMCCRYGYVLIGAKRQEDRRKAAN